jgi:hypothetical protein
MNWHAFVAVLLLPAVVLAQTPPIEDIPEGDDKITSVKEGQKAPYKGQLFDPPTALRWANWLRQYKLRLKTDVLREQKVCEAKVDYEGKVLTAEKDRNKTIETDLKVRLTRSEKARLEAEEEARNPPWYRTVWFGTALGVVGTLGVTFAVVQVVNTGK